MGPNDLTASGLTKAAKDRLIAQMFPNYLGGRSGTGEFAQYLQNTGQQSLFDRAVAQWKGARPWDTKTYTDDSALRMTNAGIPAWQKDALIKEMFPQYSGGMSGTNEFGAWLDENDLRRKWDATVSNIKTGYDPTYNTDPTNIPGMTQGMKNDLIARMFPMYTGGKAGTGEFGQWLDTVGMRDQWDSAVSQYMGMPQFQQAGSKSETDPTKAGPWTSLADRLSQEQYAGGMTPFYTGAVGTWGQPDSGKVGGGPLQRYLQPSKI